jgi:hypothetical protein
VGETPVEKIIVEEDAHLDLDWVNGIVVTSMTHKRKEEDRKRKESQRQMMAQEIARKERAVNEYPRNELEGTCRNDNCGVILQPLLGWVQQLLCCNKFLHDECVNKLMNEGGRNKKCPLCRADLQPDIYKSSKARSVAAPAKIGERIFLPAEENFGASMDTEEAGCVTLHNRMEIWLRKGMPGGRLGRRRRQEGKVNIMKIHRHLRCRRKRPVQMRSLVKWT